MKTFSNTQSLLRAIFSGLCLAAFGFGAVTQLQARTFLANDYASYKAAVDEINANNSGADTIRIVGDILVEKELVIKGDVTIIGDTNSDGTPKYTMDCNKERGIMVEIQNHCTIENVKVTNNDPYATSHAMRVTMGSGVNDCNVKINNCIITGSADYGAGGLSLQAESGTYQQKISITNCTVSNPTSINSPTGIEAMRVRVRNPEDFIIQNCVFNNNYNGIDIRWAENITISNCVANENFFFGIRVFNDNKHVIIDNCTANGNQYGFYDYTNTSNAKVIVSNTIASNNEQAGFEVEYYQFVNCIADNNGKSGFNADYAIFDKCLARNNGTYGFVTYGLISNSTAVNNGGNNSGGIRGHCVINCTSVNNYSEGISSPYIYNSIAYETQPNSYGYADDIDYNTFTYNSVYGTGDPDSTINCTQDDPRLQGKTVAGGDTNDPAQTAYYTLDDGSSALELADRSLITRENLMEAFEYQDWFFDVITEDYIASILLYDQMGNPRQFNGDRYDAGSIASNIGSGSNLIFSYDPKKVANYGKSTLTFYGKNIDDRITITLKKQGESDIVAETIQNEYSATGSIYKCYATFDFHNKKTGQWDIFINFGDTTETIKNGLEIESVIDTKIRMEIIGPANVANNSWATYTIKYANTGNTTVYCVPVIVEIITTQYVSVEVKEKWNYVHTDGVYTDKYATIDGVVHKLDTLHDFSGAYKYTTFVTPIIMNIPPYGKGTLTFKVKFKFGGDIVNEPIEFRAYSLQPMVDVDPETSKINFVMPMAGGSDALWGCLQTVAKMVWDVVKIPLGAIPGVGCGIQIAESLHSVGTQGGVGNASWETGKVIAECASDFVPLGAAAKTAISIFKGLSTANDIMGHAAGIASCLSSLIGNGLSEGEVAELMAMLEGSLDPNDKCGPLSESGSTWFNDRDEFTYVINFENSSEASAPAQQVWVTDNLDMNVFDLNTFEAGIMKIGDRMITDIPFNAQNYTWTVDMRPEMDLITEIQLTLNKSTGVATWYFKSIDPATGELPIEASVGFLPPNDEDGAGQGFVMFTIKLKEGLADDVVVANKATIIFDNNAPIVTPEWVNEKDVVPPTSTMLRPTNITGEIELTWQGTDDSSGVYCYDIYLKQDSGDYERIIARTTDTSMPFTVEDGVTYSLYSIATDNAGNRENDKTQPDIRIPEDRLPFDDYAVTKWNNTFMLNLRKLSDDGYAVASCRWFKDNELIGDGFSYSAGPESSDTLKTGIYYFQIITKNGDERYSTNKIIGSQHNNKLCVYPNPVPQGSRLTVEGVEPGNLVEVYNYMGVCVSRTVATGNVIEMMLAAPAGVYVVRANGEAVKVIIK